MTFLLDINVLIALVDPAHVGHDVAHDWFGREGAASWATCPITENGLVRIIGNPRYPNSLGSPAAVAPLLTQLRAHPGHVFWSDDVSLVASPFVRPAEITTPDQVTDTYLLALARAHDGRLATLDRRLSTRAVPGGAAALKVIGKN